MKKIAQPHLFIIACIFGLITCFFVFKAFYPFFAPDYSSPEEYNDAGDFIEGGFDLIGGMFDLLFSIIGMFIYFILAGVSGVVTGILFSKSMKLPGEKKNKKNTVPHQKLPRDGHREPSRPFEGRPPSR